METVSNFAVEYLIQIHAPSGHNTKQEIFGLYKPTPSNGYTGKEGKKIFVSMVRLTKTKKERKKENNRYTSIIYLIIQNENSVTDDEVGIAIGEIWKKKSYIEIIEIIAEKMPEKNKLIITAEDQLTKEITEIEINLDNFLQ